MRVGNAAGAGGTPARSHAKRRLFRALAILLGVGVTIGLLELLSSIVMHYLPDLEDIAPEDLREEALLKGQSEGSLPMNRFGLRGEEIADLPGSNTARFLLLGGSVVWGWTSRTLEDTLAAYLERDLTDGRDRCTALRGKRIEVLNAGFPGYASQRSVEVYTQSQRELEPAVVINLCGTNEVYAALRTGASGPSVPGFEENSWLWNTKTARLWRRLSPPAFDKLSPPSPESVAAMLRSSVQTLADAGRRDGTRIMIVLQPMSVLPGKKPLTEFEEAALSLHETRRLYGAKGARPYFRACYDAFASVLRELAATSPELLVFDATDAFRDIRENAYVDDCHLTPRGRRILAKAIADELLRGLN